MAWDGMRLDWPEANHSKHVPAQCLHTPTQSALEHDASDSIRPQDGWTLAWGGAHT